MRWQRIADGGKLASSFSQSKRGPCRGRNCGASHARSSNAQGASDIELSRLLQQPRILLKGGVVLTLDRQVGDFAQADVLIEDGKIREVRPNIVASDDAAAVIDMSDRILIPGFIDTHSHSYQGILRNILSNGRVDPDYNRDIIGKLTPALSLVLGDVACISASSDYPTETGLPGIANVVPKR